MKNNPEKIMKTILITIATVLALAAIGVLSQKTLTRSKKPTTTLPPNPMGYPKDWLKHH